MNKEGALYIRVRLRSVRESVRVEERFIAGVIFGIRRREDNAIASRAIQQFPALLPAHRTSPALRDKIVEMPSIEVAMRRSLRRGVLDLVIGPLLRRQQNIPNAPAGTPNVNDAANAAETVASIPGKINDVKTTFSSWDSCMKATYCK